jgi:hypothetical protein
MTQPSLRAPSMRPSMRPSMQLYYNPFSSSARRAVMTALELDAPVELVRHQARCRRTRTGGTAAAPCCSCVPTPLAILALPQRYAWRVERERPRMDTRVPAHPPKLAARKCGRLARERSPPLLDELRHRRRQVSAPTASYFRMTL